MKLPIINDTLQPKVKRMGRNTYSVILMTQPVADFATRAEAQILVKDLRRVLRRCNAGQFWYFGHMTSAIGAWAGTALLGAPYIIGNTSTIEG